MSIQDNIIKSHLGAMQQSKRKYNTANQHNLTTSV